MQLAGAQRPGLRPARSAGGGQRTVEFGSAGIPPAAEPRGVRPRHTKGEALTVLAADLVDAYTQGFWGYGCLQSRTWIVGMEEGGARSPDEVLTKMIGWRERGEPLVQDLRSVHAAKGLDRWFSGDGRLQPTWSKLIYFLLALEGVTVSRDSARDYQRTRLGREGGSHALLELLPLPAPGTGSWSYDRWTDLPYLASRQTYQSTVMPRRVASLRSLLAEHQPPIMLCYGVGHFEQWQAVAGMELRPSQACGRSVWFTNRAGTTFAVVPHPTARGVTNELFVDVARRIIEGAV